MNKDGIIIISDSISSFPRDNIPFEERVIVNLGEENYTLARKVFGKNAAHCLDLVRNKASELKTFVDSVENIKAYILLGFSETRYIEGYGKNVQPNWDFWFSRCLKSIAVELDALGVPVCFCLPNIAAKNMPLEHRKWLKNAAKNISGWAMGFNCETLNISLKSDRDWRYPNFSSISFLAKRIADDFMISKIKEFNTSGYSGEGLRTFVIRG